MEEAKIGNKQENGAEIGAPPTSVLAVAKPQNSEDTLTEENNAAASGLIDKAPVALSDQPYG